MEAVDAIFSELLKEEGSGTRTVELDNKIAVLEHDYDQQNKAEAEVIEKSNAIRKLAQELMTLSNVVTDIQDKSLSSASGKKLLEDRYHCRQKIS